MSLYIPRLSRAVSDFLQLHPQDATHAFEIIEESLYDARTVDSVYNLLMLQATREAFSPFLVGKSVAFMRRYLARHPPKLETLERISQFCFGALKACSNRNIFGIQNLERSLHFLRTLVGHLVADAQLNSNSIPDNPDFETELKPVMMLPSVPSRDMAMSSLGANEIENGDASSMTSRFGSTPNLGAASAYSLPFNSSPSMELHPSGSHQIPRRPTPGAPTTPSRRPESSIKVQNQILASLGSINPLVQESHVHPRSRSISVVEQFMFEMLKFRPPLIWTPSELKSPQEIEDDSWQSVANIKGLACPEHLWTVADMQRSAFPGENRSRSSNVTGTGPLFQYRSYQEQESLKLKGKDLLLVVNTVCTSQRIPEDSVWGDMPHSEVWDTTGQKSIGQAAATIFIKLIMDMYLEHGAEISYVLVLQMLHQALQNEDASVRVRSFDLIYNLSIHSLMLSNTPDDTFFEKQEGTSPTTRLGTLQEENHDTNVLHLSLSLPRGRLQDSLSEMIPWIRSLLFDLMVMLDEMDERVGSVWSAAVACFFHLCTVNGEFSLLVVQHFPVSVLTKILRICIEAAWSDEIYSHLLRLLIKLLYMPETTGYHGRKVNESRFHQCGGMEEILFHLRSTHSMLDASLLVQLLIDCTSQTNNINTDALMPLLSSLLSAAAMDVIVARCRHGEKGIGDILQAALQNCIIEKSAVQDSPKKPVHHRYKSQSSFLSSDTTASVQPGLDPDALSSWKAILSRIDDHLCFLSLPPSLEEAAEKLRSQSEASALLQEILSSDDHETRMVGVRWMRDQMISQVPHRIQQEDKLGLSLFPPGYSEDSANAMSKAMYDWLSLGDEDVGLEMSLLVEELVSRLISSPLELDGLQPRTVVHRLGSILFRTLHSAVHWIRLLPPVTRRRSLVCIGFHVCQIIHAPHVVHEITSLSAAEGVVSMPGPFVYRDYIFGSGSVYILLLRLAPIDFLLDLASDLDAFRPRYNDEVGFLGRPGHKTETKGLNTNFPWTDSVSDIRCALVLLLLHRCGMDPKGKSRLEEICKALRVDADVRVRYAASRHLLKHLMEERADACRSALRKFVAKAQQMNNERLVDNPYLQVEHILESENRTG